MIYYICHYSCDEIKSQERNSSPATQYKVKYIIDTLAKVQSESIEVISPSETKKQALVKGTFVQLANNVRLKTFISFNSKYKLLRIWGHLITRIAFYIYVLKKIKPHDKVIVYHSLMLMKIVKFAKFIKRFELIIEAEEIYADVIGNRKLKHRELRYLQLADSYLFPTILLNNFVNVKGKPFIIIHGAYNVESVRNSVETDSDKKYIHCVYAGTFDPRKGGVETAIMTAEYLPNNYHLHILGFGTATETQNVKKTIEEVSKRSRARITYDGLLSGEEYIVFIQKCDIGLSTQNPKATFNDTSFPSKILSYMANGLQVVSVRIPVVETSQISQFIIFYDKPTPKDIANAIMNVKYSVKDTAREAVKDLDEDFMKNLRRLL